MMKLKVEEKENLDLLLDTPGWNVLCKVMQQLAKDFEIRVMSYNLEEGPQGLMIAKARAEGASTLYKRIIDVKGKMNKQDP